MALVAIYSCIYQSPVVYSLLFAIICVCVWGGGGVGPCFVMHYLSVLSSFVIISLGKRELVTFQYKYVIIQIISKSYQIIDLSSISVIKLRSNKLIISRLLTSRKK